MVKYEPEQAWKWRLRAQALRGQAQTTKDLRARAAFVMLAEEWDRKAEGAERPPWQRASASPDEGVDGDPSTGEAAPHKIR